MRMGRGEADLEHIMRAHPRVQRHPPSAEAMGVDQRRDIAVELCLPQGLHHDMALPGAVRLGLPVLDGAAAANGKMRAKRRDALWACAFDCEQAPSIGMAVDGLGFDGFA